MNKVFTSLDKSFQATTQHVDGATRGSGLGIAGQHSNPQDTKFILSRSLPFSFSKPPIPNPFSKFSKWGSSRRNPSPPQPSPPWTSPPSSKQPHAASATTAHLASPGPRAARRRARSASTRARAGPGARGAGWCWVRWRRSSPGGRASTPPTDPSSSGSTTTSCPSICCSRTRLGAKGLRCSSLTVREAKPKK